MFNNHLMKVCLAAVFAIGLTACSSSSDNDTPAGDDDTAMSDNGTSPPPAEPEPTPGEAQMSLINDALGGLATALMALDADSPTVAQMAAVDAAIALLDNALTGAVDLSPNQTAAARDELASARTTVAAARTTHGNALALAARRMTQMGAISDAQTDLADAVEALMADDAASITAVNAAIAELQTAIDAGDDLSDAEKMSAMSDLMDAEVDAATAELDMYKAAAMVADATDEALLAAYQGKLKSATRLVAALEANDGPAADIADANQVIGSATTMVATLKEKIRMAAEAEANARRLAGNLVSMQVAKAVIAHAPGGETRTGTALPNAFKDHVDPAGDSANPTAWAITRTSSAAKIMLNQTTPVAAGDKYASAPAGSVSSWYAGRTYSRSSMSGRRPVMERAAVYTDIEMAADEAWEDFFDTNAADTTGVVTLSARTTDTVERVSSGIAPRAPEGADASETRTIALASKTTETRVPGTYFGVSGVYVCAATTLCTVARDRDGVLTFVGLTFAPTVSATDILSGPRATVKAKYADPDTDYTHFGYWMRSTTQRDGTKTHAIETFHGGANATALALGEAGTPTVLGTAKYYGAAAGVYVKKDGAGDSLVVTDGTFTADAMLTARFGGSSIAAADQYEVEGTISGFMDGSTDLGFADLSLGGPDARGGASFNATGAITGGETDGGGTSGHWIGQFYGNAGLNADGTDRDPDGAGPLDAVSDNFPSDVAGEFNGHFTNGHVAGAFGAEYDQ